MKKLFFALFLIMLVVALPAQVIRQISMDAYGNSVQISFLIDESVIVNISMDGNIIDWGIENNSIYNYEKKLDKYMGRVEYYSTNENEAYRGKAKYIGRTAFTYYTADENEMFKGKIKAIGSIPLAYYAVYDDESFRGKIKNAGIISLTWFGSLENDAYKGKLKTVGPAALNYYTAFDDKAFKGKIKNIGGASFTYYSSLDRIEYRGTMKTGSRTPIVNGIKYFIRY